MPLDHDRPRTQKISIASIRQPAADPSQRLGSIVLNPGGPGGSGVDFVRGAGPFLFTEEVRAKFDLVGFDPRGIIRSEPLRCFRNERQWEPYFTPFAFPTTPEEIEAWIAADRYLLRACDRRAGRIIDHMATADVARYMDLLRQALGEHQLNYVGYSYGSYLGVTYANLFPDRFRSLVVDGVLDPVQRQPARATPTVSPCPPVWVAIKERNRRWTSSSGYATRRSRWRVPSRPTRPAASLPWLTGSSPIPSMSLIRTPARPLSRMIPS